MVFWQLLDRDLVPVWASHPVAVVVSTVKLLGLGLSLHHGVHGLQVGGVGHQRQRDVPVRHAVDSPVIHSQMVLDVAGALRRKPQLMSPKQRWSLSHGLKTASC